MHTKTKKVRVKHHGKTELCTGEEIAHVMGHMDVTGLWKSEVRTEARAVMMVVGIYIKKKRDDDEGGHWRSERTLMETAVTARDLRGNTGGRSIPVRYFKYQLFVCIYRKICDLLWSLSFGRFPSCVFCLSILFSTADQLYSVSDILFATSANLFFRSAPSFF